MSKIVLGLVALFVTVIIYKKYRVLKRYKEDKIEAEKCLKEIEGQLEKENEASTIWIKSVFFGIVGHGVFGVIAMLTGDPWFGMGILAAAGSFFTVYFTVAVVTLGWIDDAVKYPLVEATKWYLPQQKISGLEDAAEERDE